MGDALRRRDRVALEVVADVDEEVQVVALPRDLRVRAGRGVAGRAGRPAVDAERTHSVPSQRLPTLSAGPPYSPAPSWPSTAGAAAACGMLVVGTSETVSVSLPLPPV